MSSFHHERGLEPGVLRGVFPALRDGKKIATWQFVPSSPHGGKELEVEVFLVGKDALRFVARCRALPHPIEDSDIENLRKTVQRQLLEQASALTGIEWEDWLEIITKGEDSKAGPWSGWGASLQIQVNPIKRGVDPKSGRVLTLHVHGYVMDFPKPTRLGEMPPDDLALKGYRLANPHDERAYVPDTPEMRAALEDVITRMGRLRDRLAHVLSQERIHAALRARNLTRLVHDLGVPGEGGFQDAQDTQDT